METMELRQLKYFVRIVELGSFSQAAKDLYVAQPALSAQINNLEADLATRLLSRSVRGVTPTEAGQSLYVHAQAVLRQIERLQEDVQGTAPSGRVSVGIPTSAANVLAGPLIAAVEKAYPEVHLRVVESLSGHLRELVTNGRIEMSLLFESQADGASKSARPETANSALQWNPLIEEELFLIRSAEAHGPVPDKVTLQDAAAMRLVLPSGQNSTRRMIDGAFHIAGLQLKLLAELDSLSTVQTIVESGQAATITSLSAFVGPGVLQRLAISSLSTNMLVRRLSLCTSEVVGLSRAAELVAGLIPTLIAELVAAGRWPGAAIVRPTAK
jgi:LysR family nitrogen assimilation transcriptional regulator